MEIRNASELIVEKLEDWVLAIIEMLPNIGLAIIIIVIALLIARLVRKVVRKLMTRVTHQTSLQDLIATVVFIAVVLVGLFVALGVLNLDKTVTSLLAGAGIIGLALGFAFQDIAANFMSGVIMAIRMPFRVGDVIETKEKMGVVHQMNLRSTIIRSFQGQYHIIPNKEVFQNTITNYSTLGKRRIDLPVGISYGDNLEKVKQITLEAVKSVAGISDNDPLQFFYTEFGDSSINFEIRFWIDFKKQPDFLQARSEAIMAIKQAYDDHDIMIPFPIRTLDFGIKGGEKLTEMLPRNLYNGES